MPEEREVFANLTVDENLRMGEQRPVSGAVRWTVAQMFDYFPQLKVRRNRRADRGLARNSSHRSPVAFATCNARA